jgi:hypothetical protein
MKSNGTYKRLYDIPALPNSIMKQKFMGLTENDWYDENTNDNFRKETLRYTGTDKPLFEHELPRKDNIQRDLMLRLHANGTPYDHAPYHPELFLGEMTPDPRGVENTPNVREIADHARFRQERYIEGKLQDTADTRTEKVASSKELDRYVYKGYDDTVTRLTNLFDDSIDSAVRKTNPNPGRTIQKVGDNLKEDQKFHQSQSETIIPKMGYKLINKSNWN